MVLRARVSEGRLIPLKCHLKRTETIWEERGKKKIREKERKKKIREKEKKKKKKIREKERKKKKIREKGREEIFERGKI